MKLPTIEPWPAHREQPTAKEIAEIRELTGASEEDLAMRKKEVSQYLGACSIEFLSVAGDRVVDLYFKAHNKKRAEHGRDYKLSSQAIDPYAKALLEELQERNETGDLDPDMNDALECIAYRVVKGAAVANSYTETYLADVGLATQCTFPPHLGQSS